MNCNAFARELSRMVRRRRSDLPPRLERHAAACPRCRAAWEDCVLVDAAVSRWRERVPKADLAFRVLAAARSAAAGSRLPRADSAPPARSQGRGALPLAVATLALLIVLAVLVGQPSQRNIARLAPTHEASPAFEPRREQAFQSESVADSDVRDGAPQDPSGPSGPGTLALVAGITELVPGPWELASALGEETDWSADAARWLAPWSLLPNSDHD
ncbi:MAG: hypothetical protein WD069_05035 [Planctomycetales bacterium]